MATVADNDEDTAVVPADEEANETSNDTAIYEQRLALVMHICSNDSDTNSSFEEIGKSDNVDN